MGSPLEIVVCIKSVPDPKCPAEVNLDSATGLVRRSADRVGIPRVMSPLDRHAVEEGLRIKETLGGRITTLTMDLPIARDVLLESLALGADRAVLITGAEMAGADTLATARTLASAIRKLGRFDIVLCGSYSYHGHTAQVGPELAEILTLPHISFVRELSLQRDGWVKVVSDLDDRYLTYRARLPLLLTVTKDLNEPRGISLMGLVQARTKEIITWKLNDIGLKLEEVGLRGSPTKVVAFSRLETGRNSKRLAGSPGDQVTALLRELPRGVLYEPR